MIWGDKVDYNTWFGAGVVYALGINMIPFTPLSELYLDQVPHPPLLPPPSFRPEATRRPPTLAVTASRRVGDDPLRSGEGRGM